MSTAFNLTAQLNLRGPTNVRNIVSSIRRQLGTISADVNLRIDPAATRNLTQLNTALTNFNRTLNTTQTNATTTANALRGLANAIGSINANNLPRNMANIATASNRAAQATGRVTTQVEQARNQMEEFGRQSALAVRRFAAFSISAGIIVGFTNAVNKGVKAFIDFDKELVKLQQVTGESAKGLAGLQKTIGDLASGLGVSSSELINVSSTLAQAGLSARDTEKALKALALSSLAPSFDDMNKTVEGSIALMRQFGIGAGQLDQALGSVNAVAAKFAVEASDIIAAIQRTGGVFAAASKGVSEGTQALNEFIAVFTSIRATTRESAETIATGLRTIFTRVQRGETIEALKQYGVNLTDLEGKFVGAYKAVELLSRGLNQIDPRDLRFSQIVEELGGFRQIGKVIPLIQQFATAQQALAVAQRGQGSLAEDAAIAQLSLANQIAKVREEFLTLIRDIGGTDTFQTIAKSALGLASALIKVADSVKGVIPVLGVVMAIRGTAALSSYARGFAGGMSRGGGGRRAAQGGYIKYAEGGQVPVALMPGEAVIYPDAAKRIGTPTLRKMNYADRRQKRARGGSVGMVPGTGNTDSFYTTLPEGSFVIRKAATKAMGAGNIANIASGKQRFAEGGSVQKFKDGSWRTVEAQVRAGRGRPSKNTTTVGDAVDKISNKSYDNRKGRFKSDFPFIIRGLNRSGTKSQINEEKILDKYLKRGVDDLSKAIVAQTQNNITIPSGDVGIQNKESIYGGLFETALLKISNKSRDKKENNQNFDFPRGIGSTLSNMFSGMPPDISTDVKRTAAANAAMKTNVANKIANEMVAGKPQRVAPVGVVALSPTDSAIVSKISGVEVDKLLNTKLKQKSKDRMQRAFGGLIQKLAKGGKAKRNVGYIDSDEITQLLKDTTKGPLIKAEMDRLGIKGVAEYKEYLSNLAASRRNDGSLKKLTSIFGVAGSGKSTLLQGGSQGTAADNAKLRKTNRYPILTESDLLKSDQVIDSTSVAGPTQKAALSAADRVIALSSRTKESQEILKKQRKSRDTSGKNLFGRKPGSTKSAPLDSGIGEAYIAASGVSGVDPKRVTTLKIGENFKKTRTGQPSVRTPETTGLFYGNFGPTTKGHVSVVKEAEKLGIPAKDFVALVGGDTPIDPSNKDPHSRRTAIFPQKSSDQLPSRLGMARAAFGAMGANVSAMPKNSSPGSIPPAFKVGEDSYIVPKGKKDIAFVGDEKEAGSLAKYEKLGYSVKSLPRSEGISGTKARDAIMANDTAALKNLLSPEGFDYVQKHMDTLQKRPKLLDSILSKIESNSASGRGTAGRLAKVKSALSDLPARVSKTTPADIVSKIESLRKERDSLSSKLGRLPARLVSRMEQRQRFAGGSSDPLKKKRVKKINPDDYTQSIQNLQADPNSILRQKAVGVAILQGPKKGTVDSSVSKKSILQSVGKQYSDLLGSAIGGGSIGIQREALKPQVYKDFNEGIENGLVQAVNTAVATISNKYPELPKPAINGEEERRKYLKGVNDGAKGNMFEEILTSMKNKGVYDANPDPQRSFDFAPTKGSAFGLSNVFDKISSLLYVDAKAASPSDAAMSKKIANQTLRDLGVIKGRQSKDEPDLASVESAIAKRFQSLGPDASVSLLDLQKEIPNAKMKMVNSVAKRMGLAVGREKGQTNFRRQRLAIGGPVGGQSKEYKMTGLTGGSAIAKAVQQKRRLNIPEIKKISSKLGLEIIDNDAQGYELMDMNTGRSILNKTTLDDVSEYLISKYRINPDSLALQSKAMGGAIKKAANQTKPSLYKSDKDKSFDSKKLAEFLGSKPQTTDQQRLLAEQLKDAKTSSVSKVNYEELLKNYAKGGEVPIMAQEGEYVINRKSAKAIGYGNLHRLNKYHSGGKVQKLAAGGPLDTAMATMSARDSNKLKATMAANTRAFEKLEKGVQGWPIDAVQAAMKKLARALERGEKNFTFNQKNYNKNNPSARKNKKERVGPQGKAAGSGTSNALTSAANLEANKAKTIVDLQNYEKAQYQKARKQGKTAQEARESSKAAAIARATKISQPMSKQEERALTAQAMRKARASGASNDNARRAGQNALNKAKAQQSARLQGAAIFNTASMTGDQTAVRNTLGGVNNNSSAASSSGGGGGGRSGKRRVSSSRGGQQPDRDNNGRIMGMGRLTQAGFGISMMGGLGSQFFNPEASASNAANAAFTESFTSTIGMGATVAGSIGDLFGGGGDDNNNKKKKRPKGSRNRGPSTPTRPPSGGGGGGGRGGSGGGGSTRSGGSGASRGGGPRAPSGGGSGGGGAMGMLGGIGGALAGIAVVGLAVAEGLKAAHNAAREFAINLANTKLEESLEKATKSIEKFSNNLNDSTAQTKAKQDTLEAVKSADALDAAYSKPEAGLFNLTDAMSGEQGSFERSQILNKKGIGAFLSTTNLFAGSGAAQNQAAEFQTIIPELASQKAKRYTGAAEASSSFIEAKVRSGSNIDQMKADPAEFERLTKSLALADAAIQEQILSIQNSTTIDDAEKQKRIASTVAIAAENKARDIQTKTLRDKALENLNKTTNLLQNSLERMFQNMDQAINANIASLDKLSAQAELTTASLSGQAKIGTSLKLDSITTLDNPRVFDTRSNKMAVSQASSIFGAEANKMSGLLQLGNKLEGSLMATVNKTLKDNKGSTNEAVGAKLESVISNSLSDLQIPDDVALNLGKEMTTAIQEMRKKGEDKVDFSELTEKIPQLSKVVESSKRAHEIAKRALEQWQNAVNEYAGAINQITEMQVEASMRSRRANNIMIQGENDLQRALGKEISLREAKNNTLQGFSDQTGGLSDPRSVGRNIRNLEVTRSEQQALYNAAGNKGPGASGEVKMMGDELLRTNTALRENYDALKNMADNTDIASAALNKISEIKQQRQAGVGFAEKLVSSTPKELANLNMSMARLQNNMAGRMNVSNPSQRSGDLQLFNELAPLLGDRQSEMKANVLENMLKESGVGVSPMMQEILDSLRNPQADPAMQEAIATYKEGVALQATANTELSKLAQLMADNTADIAAQKLVQSLQGVTLTFDSARLNDINQGIQLLLAEVKAHNGAGMSGAPAAGKARGGLIYASEGTMVDFKPQGTDTVPAMLTPGEFVVNRKATQKNLGLLKQINNNGYASGGKVKYYADGGYVFGKEWSPMSNLVETEDTAHKRALDRYDADATEETKNYLPALNWERLNRGIDKQTLYSIKNPGFYAVNSKAGMISKSWITSTSEDAINNAPLDLSGLSWAPGGGYESFSVIEGGAINSDSIGSELQNVKTTPPPGDDPISIPTKEWLSDVKSPISKRIKVLKTEKDEWIRKLTASLASIPAMTDKGDAIEIDGKTIYKDIGSLLPSPNKPNIKTKLITDKAQYLAATNPPSIKTLNKVRQIEVSNLAAKGSKPGNALLLSAEDKANIMDSSDKGNFIGIRQDTSNERGLVELATMGITAATRGLGDLAYDAAAGADARTGGSLSTAIVAGETAAKNFGGINNFGAVLAQKIKPVMAGAYTDNVNKNFADLSILSGIKENVQLALEELKNPSNYVTSNSTSGNQDYARKLQALAEGIVFKQMFSENELKPAKGAGPYTLYNMTSPDDIAFWKMATKAAEQSGGADRGSYAATEADFIDIFRSDKGRLNKIKSVPWVNSGFRDMSFLDKKEEQRNKDKTQAAIKITNALFKGKYLSFPYKKIVSKLWDSEKKRFDGAEESFNIIDAGGAFDKNNPNPFSELLLPNFSGIRTDNAEAIGQALDAQALANQGKQFSLKGTNAFVASRMDPSSREISTSGITDAIMKDNIYIRGDATLKPDWITQQYEQLFLAKQQKQKEEKDAAAAGKADVGNEFKQNLTPAQRTSLARALHKVALKNRVGMVGPVPSKKEDIYRNIELLGRTLSLPKINNEVAARASAARYLFSTILNDSGSKLASLLSSQGLDLNTMFTIPAGMISRVSRKKVARPGFRNREMQDMYYQLIPEAQKKIEALFQTLMDAEASGAKFRQFDKANKLDQETQNQLKLEGAKIADVNPKTGEITYKSAKETIPKSYQEIADLALNPYNRFPEAMARKPYLDKLLEVVMNGKGPFNQPLYKGKIKEKISTDLATLKQFYTGEGLANFKGLDFYTNTKAKTADVAAQWETFIKSAQANEFDDLYKKAQEAHFFLTANSKGMLPNKEKLSAMLATNATEEAKKPKMASKGGVIYASTGTLVDYQPRGTDTVPAMLTPGEFVINRQATQRNLPLLKAINSNRYQTGGIVQPQYHEIGNMVSGASKAVGAIAGAVGIKLDTNKLETEINKVLSDGAKLLSGALQLSGQDRNALSTFGDNFRSLLSQMSQINIPPEIRFSMQPVQVNITGAQGLTDAAQSLVNGAIKKAFASFLSVNDLNGTYKPPE